MNKDIYTLIHIHKKKMPQSFCLYLNSSNIQQKSSNNQTSTRYIQFELILPKEKKKMKLKD